MPATRLVRIGNSLGFIVPKRLLDAMSWWQADILHIEGRDGKIIISNLNTKQVRPFHEPIEQGDTVSHKA